VCSIFWDVIQHLQVITSTVEHDWDTTVGVMSEIEIGIWKIFEEHHIFFIFLMSILSLKIQASTL
jgi:hypothetical protein